MTLEELAHLQAEFAAALAAHAPGPTPRDVWLQAHFAAAGGHGAQALGRYRGALRQHGQQALSRTYPVVHALVGAAFFAELARAYGDAHPSTHADLGRFGAQLAAFLETYAPVAAYPYCADVARLEWAVHGAHTAADALALDAAKVARLDAAQLDGMRLRLHPACVLHESPWASAAVWQAHQGACDEAGTPRAAQAEAAQAPAIAPVARAAALAARACAVPRLPQPVARSGTRALVYRSYWRVEVREVDAVEWAALRRLARGASLGAALQAAQACHERLRKKKAPGEAFDPGRLLLRWLADRVLVQAHG